MGVHSGDPLNRLIESVFLRGAPTSCQGGERRRRVREVPGAQGAQLQEPGLKAGRPIDDNYVTKQWLFDQYGKTCPGCGDCFRFELDKGKVEGNLTADPIDCDEGHHLSNRGPYV